MADRCDALAPLSEPPTGCWLQIEHMSDGKLSEDLSQAMVFSSQQLEHLRSRIDVSCALFYQFKRYDWGKSRPLQLNCSLQSGYISPRRPFCIKDAMCATSRHVCKMTCWCCCMDVHPHDKRIAIPRSVLAGTPTAAQSRRLVLQELETEKVELRRKQRELRLQQQQLHKGHQAKQARIAELEAKCMDVQMLKFGQLIDVELLDRLGASKGTEDLSEQLKQQVRGLSRVHCTQQLRE
jgi:hypothetical protein